MDHLQQYTSGSSGSGGDTQARQPVVTEFGYSLAASVDDTRFVEDFVEYHFTFQHRSTSEYGIWRRYSVLKEAHDEICRLLLPYNDYLQQEYSVFQNRATRAVHGEEGIPTTGLQVRSSTSSPGADHFAGPGGLLSSLLAPTTASGVVSPNFQEGGSSSSTRPPPPRGSASTSAAAVNQNGPADGRFLFKMLRGGAGLEASAAAAPVTLEPCVAKTTGVLSLVPRDAAGGGVSSNTSTNSQNRKSTAVDSHTPPAVPSFPEKHSKVVAAIFGEEDEVAERRRIDLDVYLRQMLHLLEPMLWRLLFFDKYFASAVVAPSQNAATEDGEASLMLDGRRSSTSNPLQQRVLRNGTRPRGGENTAGSAAPAAREVRSSRVIPMMLDEEETLLTSGEHTSLNTRLSRYFVVPESEMVETVKMHYEQQERDEAERIREVFCAVLLGLQKPEPPTTVKKAKNRAAGAISIEVRLARSPPADGVLVRVAAASSDLGSLSRETVLVCRNTALDSCDIPVQAAMPEPGDYLITVSAFNLAGESATVSIGLRFGGGADSSRDQQLQPGVFGTMMQRLFAFGGTSTATATAAAATPAGPLNNLSTGRLGTSLHVVQGTTNNFPPTPNRGTTHFLQQELREPVGLLPVQSSGSMGERSTVIIDEEHSTIPDEMDPIPTASGAGAPVRPPVASQPVNHLFPEEVPMQELPSREQSFTSLSLAGSVRIPRPKASPVASPPAPRLAGDPSYESLASVGRTVSAGEAATASDQLPFPQHTLIGVAQERLQEQEDEEQQPVVHSLDEHIIWSASSLNTQHHSTTNTGPPIRSPNSSVDSGRGPTPHLPLAVNRSQGNFSMGQFEFPEMLLPRNSRRIRIMSSRPLPADDGHGGTLVQGGINPSTFLGSTTSQSALFANPIPNVSRADEEDEDEGENVAGLDERELCCACLERRRTHAFIPCGHKVVCARCGRELLTNQPRATWSCPVCREPAIACIRIFDS
ncbi:unnamed protein product [Amoebophrya sp. A120]|nr:unnamed protein product [Amoebophrya sp. A120]|eukprot:GSA120T00022706001.1